MTASSTSRWQPVPMRPSEPPTPPASEPTPYQPPPSAQRLKYSVAELNQRVPPVDAIKAMNLSELAALMRQWKKQGIDGASQCRPIKVARERLLSSSFWRVVYEEVPR
jgi:hypothetical protein